jgi:hypothetical protein
VSDSRACELCGLDVGVRPFVLDAEQRQLLFCCEGCRGIYQMLHDIKDTPAPSGENRTQKS